MLKKGWNNTPNMFMMEVGSHMFVLGFQEQETPRKIMDKALWNIKGCLVHLK